MEVAPELESVYPPEDMILPGSARSYAGWSADHTADLGPGFSPPVTENVDANMAKDVMTPTRCLQASHCPTA